MKSTDFTPQFATLWAASASTATLQYPLLSGSSAGAGRATIASGFSAANFTPPEAGGTYPYGQDFNGALRTLSVSAQNYESGVVPVFSSAFASGIGGYPLNALVQSGGVFYVSTTDANTTTPGASGAAWKSLFAGLITARDWTTVSGTTGYRISPDGEIEMWGIATVPASGLTYSQVNISFPFQFPNECYFCMGKAAGLASSDGGWPSISSDQETETGARLTAECFGAYKFSNSVLVPWFARGF